MTGPNTEGDWKKKIASGKWRCKHICKGCQLKIFQLLYVPDYNDYHSIKYSVLWVMNTYGKI